MQEATYVTEDSEGILRVGDTRVMLDSVLAGFFRGESPETIQREYPSLSLEEVYGAITYYLSHRNEVDEYLKRQDEFWAELKDKIESQPSPVVERLRALQASKV